VKPVSRFRKIFDWSLGLALIAVGIVGLVLPGLQGILMIVAGLAILSSHWPLARRINEKLKDLARRARDRVVKKRDVSDDPGDGEV
jgi:membrane protein implicated in regulation of membrane protease activity